MRGIAIIGTTLSGSAAARGETTIVPTGSASSTNLSDIDLFFEVTGASADYTLNGSLLGSAAGID